MPVPNWGPMAGQDVQNADEYARQYPPPEGGAFTSASVGAGGVHTGPAITDPEGVAAAGSYMEDNPIQDTYWSDYFARGLSGQEAAMPAFNTTNQDQARAAQMRAIQDLQGQAAGSLGTQAQQQLAQGYGQAGAQQSSLGSTFRGQNAGAAMRGIQAGQQGIQRGFAGDQQMLKLQEQQAAQAMLAQLLAQQQGQDINQATLMAQHQLTGAGLTDAMKQFYLGGGIGVDVGNRQLGIERIGTNLGINNQLRDISSGINGLLGRTATGAGAGAAGTLQSMFPRGGSTEQDYRQIDGQDSIVPVEDK